MVEVINFLNSFFESEANAIKASDEPNLNNFNNKLEKMNQFLAEEVKNKLGLIPLKELKTSDYYERVKDYPKPDLRFLFRIDEYNNQEYGQLYKCFVSDSNPDDWKSYLNLFIVGKEGSEYKILSVFFFSDKGMGGDKQWCFNAGNEMFRVKKDGRYLLNDRFFDKRIEVRRMLEPEDDNASMKEYNKE